jgi:dihydrolipoamide dehydrogenase
MSQVDLIVPDLGSFQDVAVIDVLIKPGDVVEVDSPLVTLETDKASMDVPAAAAGKVSEVLLKRGDKVSKGSLIARIAATVQDAALNPAADRPDADRPDAARPPADGADADRPAADRPDADRPDAVRPDAPRADRPDADRPDADRPDSTAAASFDANFDSEDLRAQVAPTESPEIEVEVAAPGPSALRKPEPTLADGGPSIGILLSPGVADIAPLDTEPYDRATQLLVLGAGPGGYTAAFRAADLGLHVTLVERWHDLGGVCLNVGCIPSKALLHAAKVIEEAEEMGAHGIAFGKPDLELARLRAWKSSVVHKLTNGLRLLAKQRKIEVVHGTGHFVSPHVIQIQGATGSQRIRFDQCIIAAGSEPIQLPGLPADPRVMDSSGALELPEFSGDLLVVGGGIIGLEMACVYDALGSSVTVVELTGQLMPGCDPDLVRPLERRISARYKRILLNTKLVRAEPLLEGLRVTFEGEKAPASEVFDRVLVAVGRVPNGKSIDAELAGVNVSDRGYIPVDKQMRTNVPHIFAIGDIASPPMLAHKAMHEGKVAAEVAAGHPRAFGARVIPSVAYTDPEVAWTGLTEIEAQVKGIPYKKGAFPWIASGRSLTLGREEGFTKILFDPDTHRVLGGGIVGTNAGELITEISLAVETGCDAEDIGLTIHPHPTLSETVAGAAEAFEGTLTDLYIPRKK